MSHSHVIPIHVKFRQGDLVNFVQDLFVGENPATVSLAKCTSSFEVQLKYELRYFTKDIQGDLRGRLLV